MIYYVGYHRHVGDGKNSSSLSATNKIAYICEVLHSCRQDCVLVSYAESVQRQGLPRLTRSLCVGICIEQFHSFGRKNLLTKFCDKIVMPLQVGLYLLRHVQHGDVLLVYHATSYCGLVKWIRRRKKCSLILEMEELYSDVNGNRNLRKKEFALADAADGYVFPTQLLDEQINKVRKPSVIVHGTYYVEPKRNGIFRDEKVHVVYAGTLDPRKGGAAAAVAVAAFLPENYHIHILGFGTEKQIQQIKETCSQTSKGKHAQVTYEGVLSGEDYICFIQSCHIGLSTQNPDAAFNATSFPSKVLSYLSNGLHVVSVRIPAIERSAVGDLLEYYDQQTPECIAKAIMRVDLQAPYDARERIAQLDAQFKMKLKKLIEELSCEHSN